MICDDGRVAFSFVSFSAFNVDAWTCWPRDSLINHIMLLRSPFVVIALTPTQFRRKLPIIRCIAMCAEWSRQRQRAT